VTTPTATTASAPNAGLGRLYYLEFTIPAGTPISSPASETFPLEDNYLVSLRIRVPPGPFGQMGFRLLWAQQQVVPWGNDSWLIANDEEVTWQSNVAITSTGLVVEGYNTGNFPHTIYILALISTLSASVQQEVSETSGAVALPASQVGPESTDTETYVAPPADYEEAPPSEEESAPVLEESEPVISSSVSLVGTG